MLLIFDLDGTLIDSRLDLANAMNATLAHLHYGPLANELICSYVGNGARMLVKRALLKAGGTAASEASLEHALAYFLEYYGAHAVEKTTLYDGVESSLGILQRAGHQLAVLTNKPVRISHEILAAFDIAQFFFDVLGGDSLPFQKPNPIGIETLVKALGLSKAETWMVGDSVVDIETARNAGVSSCGVTYGLQPETFAKLPPDFLAPSFDAFAAHIGSLTQL